MAFPETKNSLIQRLASGGAEPDWQEFLADYWGPVCRFAARVGRCPWQDAEDAAAQTFVAVVEQHLLQRWVSTRSARLRTLLCTVVRHVLANRARIRMGRARLMREHAHEMIRPLEVEDTGDSFYAAWVHDLLETSIDELASESNRDATSDRFRVFYYKVCKGLTSAQAAALVGLTLRQADHAYREARERLAERLEARVREHVRRYVPPEEIDTDFAVEWASLGDFLKSHGGLEGAIRHAMGEMGEVHGRSKTQASLEGTLQRIAQKRR